jgi:hypothetical protein
MTEKLFGPVCSIFAIMIQGVSVPFTVSVAFVTLTT